MAERAPENQVEHIRQLVKVAERQAFRIKQLDQSNRTLRAHVAQLKERLGEA